MRPFLISTSDHEILYSLNHVRSNAWNPRHVKPRKQVQCAIFCRTAVTNQMRTWATVFAVIAALCPGVLLNAQSEVEFTLEKEMQTPLIWRNFPRWEAGLLVGFLNTGSGAPTLLYG